MCFIFLQIQECIFKFPSILRIYNWVLILPSVRISTDPQGLLDHFQERHNKSPEKEKKSLSIALKAII